jgi:hypothetical protein
MSRATGSTGPASVVGGTDIVVVVDEGVELVVFGKEVVTIVDDTVRPVVVGNVVDTFDVDSRPSEQLATVKTAKDKTANSTERRIEHSLPKKFN